MLILNINGPINAGKTTVSNILVNKLSRAVFIEVDDLLSDAEQKQLNLSMEQGWAERVRRLNAQLTAYKLSCAYDTVIFAYPIGKETHRYWSSMADKNTQFLNVTLAPSLENCLKNRGTRVLSDWEKNRIRQMYQEEYHNRPYADIIINNDNQTPNETAEIIKEFIVHCQNSDQQWLHLVERRWPALVSGEKTSTFRLNEGFVHRGFLVYKDCPNEKYAEVVYVNKVYYVPLRQAIAIDGFDDHTPDEATALRQMQAHYPDITLDTPILLAQHLGVPETKEKYPDIVRNILRAEKQFVR